MSTSKIPPHLVQLAERYMQAMERGGKLLERMTEIELAAASGTRPPLRSRERRIIAAIGSQALVAKQIAKLIDVEFNRGFQAVLADMVRWGLLRHDAEGYRVADGWGEAVVEDEDEEAV